MTYVCLVYHDEEKLAALTQRELAELLRECSQWVAELEWSAQHVLSAGLQSQRTATTLQQRDGGIAVTDGPVRESRESLGGFTILRARDLNEAIRLASRSPAVRIGRVEVRPLLEVGLETIDPLDRRLAAAMPGAPAAAPGPGRPLEVLCAGSVGHCRAG